MTKVIFIDAEMVSAERVGDLTLTWLRAKGACEEGLAAFESAFGESAEVTLENCRRAVDEGLDINWLVEQLPAAAWRLYQESTAPAWRLYQESIAPAWKLHEESIAAVYKPHIESTAPALYEALKAVGKLYDESLAPALKLYDEGLAAALYEALRSAKCI